MYEDWVIVDIDKAKVYSGENLQKLLSANNMESIRICKAPRWSGLKAGDLVKVEGMENRIGEVQGCITVNTEKEEDLMQFICYLADQTPRLRIVSKYTQTEMEYKE